MLKISLDNAGVRELSRQLEDWWYHHIIGAKAGAIIALIAVICFIIVIFGWTIKKTKEKKKDAERENRDL